MPKTSKLQTNFTGGELSPRIEGRPDLAKFFNGAKELENFLILPQGGITRRPGTRYVGNVKDHASRTRLIPFQFNTEQAFVLEFGHEYIRFWKNNAQVNSDAAFPAVAATNESIESTAVTTHDVNLPSGISAGHLLLVFFAIPSPLLPSPMVTFPAGWTLVRGAFSLGNIMLLCYYKIADGAEGGTIQVTTGFSFVSAHQSYRITGHDPDVAPEGVNSASATSANPNPVELNPSGWGTDNTLWIAACAYRDDHPEAVTAYPADYTDGIDTDMAVANGVGVGTARRLLQTESEDPGTFTLGKPDLWIALTIGVKPAPSVTPYEISSPYIEGDLFFIQYAQSADVVYLVHPDYAPRKLSRLADNSWVLSTVNFRPPPSFDADTDISGGSVTLTPGATTGLDVTFTASSAIFLKGDVGRQIIFGASRAIITQLGPSAGSVSPQATVKADILDAFPNTDPIAAGSWFLRGSPQVALDPNKKQPVGAKVTLITADPAFRSADVGKFIKILGGVVKITTVSSNVSIIGELLSVMSSTTDADPSSVPAGAWTMEVASWSATYGFPRAIVFHEGRLALGGTNAQPTTWWESQSDDFENFAVGPLASDALEYRIAEGQVNGIQWLAAADHLLLGDTLGELGAHGPGDQQPLGGDVTPHIKFESKEGSMPLQALRLTDGVVFVQKGKRKVYSTRFDFNSDKFIPSDLTIFAEHITDPEISQHIPSYAHEPHSVIYVLRSDGQLLACTYIPLHEVVAWSRLVTDGEFESFAIIPRPDGVGDQIWVIVKRTINSETKRYVEYFDEVPLEFADRDWQSLFTDCAFIYDGDPTDTIDGLDHLEGKDVDVVADGAYKGQETVTSGQITLEEEASTVEIGLGYTPRVVTMRPAIEGVMLEGFPRRWVKVFIRVLDSIGATINGQVAIFAQGGQPLGIAPPPFTGDKEIVNGGWDTEGRITIEQSEPYPLTILAIFGEIALGDKT